MWITNNFQQVITSIEYLNSRRNAVDTESFDFSTLYTTFDHTILKSNIKWCILKAFNTHNRIYASFYTLGSKQPMFKSVPTGSYNFNVTQAILLHDSLVDNAYFKVGNRAMLQTIGIPIGCDQALAQANMSLHHDEFMFIDKLRREKKYDVARSFNHTHRYIDDVNCKNNKGNFDKYKSEIYSKGLIVNKENIGNIHTSMLEIDMTVTNKMFVTKLYDKRDDFNFPIVKYPSTASNIHSSTIYNVFTTQIIRYSRVCNHLKYFIHATSNLIKQMCKKGCKQYKLHKLLRKIITRHSLRDKYKIVHLYKDFTRHLK